MRQYPKGELRRQLVQEVAEVVAILWTTTYKQDSTVYANSCSANGSTKETIIDDAS